MSHTVETPEPIIAENLSAHLAGTTLDDVSGSEATSDAIAASITTEPADSLFNRFAWLYVFFREKLFRDDTDRMIDALWPAGRPPAGTRMLEIGCGPGFYSCGFAARFPELRVIGVDRAARQLDCAKSKARKFGLTNCRFERDNVLDLSYPDDSFDVLVAARLFTVLPERKRAIGEMNRVLRSGGRCLIAEPRYGIWASLPLFAMWFVARCTRMDNGCREPRRAIVLSTDQFRDLFTSLPWSDVKVWQDGRYHYALCEKV